MVRFIIHSVPGIVLLISVFTFQYGQIYYQQVFFIFYVFIFFYIPIWLDLLSENNQETDNVVVDFTFQYGQIYYQFMVWHNNIVDSFYIPIWLDLLLCKYIFSSVFYVILHSNMVRFIILDFLVFLVVYSTFTFQYGQIYYSLLHF